VETLTSISARTADRFPKPDVSLEPLSVSSSPYLLPPTDSHRFFLTIEESLDQMPHQLTQAQSDHLATAQREADRTLHEEYRNAFVKVHKLQQLLEAIVKFCVNRGEESRSLEAWKKAYIKFIEGTSMREVVLKGFEEHIGLVRESVGNGKRVSRHLAFLNFAELTLIGICVDPCFS